MASHPRTSAREEERRLDIRRLVIASLASALAAVIVSQFWIAGTWMAAALTPVFVILIQEALHKPTEVIAGRFTSNGPAVLPEGTGAGPPPPAREQRAAQEERLPPRAPAEPGGERGQAPPVRVYRTGAGGGPSRPRARRRKLAIGTLVLTAVLAFAIAAFAITGTELVTGESIGKGDRNTTLFGGERRSSGQDEGTTTGEQPQQQDQQQAPADGAKDQGRDQDKQKTAPAQPEGGTQREPAPQSTAP